jgi:hypothetical protein
MNWPMARSSRAISFFSTTKRAPLMRAAASKSMPPRAAPRSTWSLGAFRRPAGSLAASPHWRFSTLPLSSSPTGTSAAGMLGKDASRSFSLPPTRASSSAAVAMTPFSASTSAIRRAASASSFLALAWPISFELSFRLAWASCRAVWAARSWASSFTASAAAPDRPLADQAASKASELSRMALMSCIERKLGKSRRNALSKARRRGRQAFRTARPHLNGFVIRRKGPSDRPSLREKPILGNVRPHDAGLESRFFPALMAKLHDRSSC